MRLEHQRTDQIVAPDAPAPSPPAPPHPRAGRSGTDTAAHRGRDDCEKILDLRRRRLRRHPQQAVVRQHHAKVDRIHLVRRARKQEAHRLFKLAAQQQQPEVEQRPVALGGRSRPRRTSPPCVPGRRACEAVAHRVLRIRILVVRPRAPCSAAATASFWMLDVSSVGNFLATSMRPISFVQSQLVRVVHLGQRAEARVVLGHEAVLEQTRQPTLGRVHPRLEVRQERRIGGSDAVLVLRRTLERLLGLADAQKQQVELRPDRHVGRRIELLGQVRSPLVLRAQMLHTQEGAHRRSHRGRSAALGDDGVGGNDLLHVLLELLLQKRPGALEEFLAQVDAVGAVPALEVDVGRGILALLDEPGAELAVADVLLAHHRGERLPALDELLVLGLFAQARDGIDECMCQSKVVSFESGTS
ncbi:hypothetical protein L1887_57951 [Cichorium endivia]|nr:hypothetical protein L1887_57951 [Cichorium endivia]